MPGTRPTILVVEDEESFVEALTVGLEREGFRGVPPNSKPVDRTLSPVSDQIQSYGIDIAPAIGSDGLGLVWAATLFTRQHHLIDVVTGVALATLVALTMDWWRKRRARRALGRQPQG